MDNFKNTVIYNPNGLITDVWGDLYPILEAYGVMWSGGQSMGTYDYNYNSVGINGTNNMTTGDLYAYKDYKWQHIDVNEIIDINQDKAIDKFLYESTIKKIIKEEIDSDWNWARELPTQPNRGEWTEEILHYILEDYIIKYDYNNDGKYYYLVDERVDDYGDLHKTNNTDIVFCWDDGDDGLGCDYSDFKGEVNELNIKATNIEVMPKEGFKFSWEK